MIIARKFYEQQLSGKLPSNSLEDKKSERKDDKSIKDSGKPTNDGHESG